MLKRVSKLSEAMSLFIRNLTMKRNNILMTFWMQVIFIYLFIYLFLADKLKETEKIMTPFDFQNMSKKVHFYILLKRKLMSSKIDNT